MVDVRLIVAGQKVAAENTCPGCGSPMVCLVATEAMGEDAAFEDPQNLQIAAGQPYLTCFAFYNLKQEQTEACLIRAHTGNCPIIGEVYARDCE